jgi:hypothetical protein
MAGRHGGKHLTETEAYRDLQPAALRAEMLQVRSLATEQLLQIDSQAAAPKGTHHNSEHPVEPQSPRHPLQEAKDRWGFGGHSICGSHSLVK